MNSSQERIKLQMILDYLKELQYPYGEIILTVGGIILLWLGYTFGKLAASWATRRLKNKLMQEHQLIQNNLSQTWELTKKKLDVENRSLSEKVANLNDRMEDYRIKIAGLGMLTFNKNKKRAELIHLLLLENELFEQVLGLALENNSSPNLRSLQENLSDMKKRKIIISEIFKDNKIQTYVREALNENLKNIG